MFKLFYDFENVVIVQIEKRHEYVAYCRTPMLALLLAKLLPIDISKVTRKLSDKSRSTMCGPSFIELLTAG
jgi:hypothetical protein